MAQERLAERINPTSVVVGTNLVGRRVCNGLSFDGCARMRFSSGVAVATTQVRRGEHPPSVLAWQRVRPRAPCVTVTTQHGEKGNLYFG